VRSSRSSFSRSIARRAVTSVKASRIVEFATGLVDHHAGVQQHGALAQAGKVVLDLEAVHRRVLGDDGLEQDPKGGDVPLPVAQVVQQAAHGVLRIDLEDLVEGPAGRQDDEAPVQHQQAVRGSYRRSPGRAFGRLQFREFASTSAAGSDPERRL
jgi:hypothetical protein